MFNKKTAIPVNNNSTNTEYQLNKDRILRPKQTKAIVQLSMPTMYRKAKDGTFPKPVKLSEKASGWLESEIYAWLDERVAERDLEVI